VKRVIVTIIYLNLIVFLNAELLFQWSYRNNKGQTIQISRYVNEPDTLYKVITTFEIGERKKDVVYYRNDPKYKKKSTVYYDENGREKKIYTIHAKDNPFYWIDTVAEYNNDGHIVTINYKQNPDNKIKEIDYYDNSNLVKAENYYFNDNTNIIKSIIYYDVSTGNKKREEQIYNSDKDSEGLKRIVLYFDLSTGKNESQEQYFNPDKQPKSIKKLIVYYENGVRVKQEQFFQKPFKGLAYKLEIFYKNEQIKKILAYDKEGNILPDPGR
jgi:hypothetical protein